MIGFIYIIKKWMVQCPMVGKKSELTIITKAKELTDYIFVATESSPKKYRYTFTARLQNKSLEVVETLYAANDVYIGGGESSKRYERRLDLQHKALTDLKVIDYLSFVASERGCLLKRQYEHLSELISDCSNLLGAWINSDKKRFASRT
ncbi:four helix bundle protein [Cloacibacillus porcorum]|uniref:four helix bundle protein n=1 Tax=Cloacibacillus porcorum TaxID=1197717 RepID=UPI003EFE2D25